VKYHAVELRDIAARELESSHASLLNALVACDEGFAFVFTRDELVGYALGTLEKFIQSKRPVVATKLFEGEVSITPSARFVFHTATNLALPLGSYLPGSRPEIQVGSEDRRTKKRGEEHGVDS
jgi:hypothetical protein